MPKAQKLSQNSSDTRAKQITDFFPRKSALPQAPASSSASCPSVAIQKAVNQTSAKENTTPRFRSLHSKIQQGSEASSNATMSSFQCTRAGSPSLARAMHVTSPMQPSTKRLRSQSVASPQPTKFSKRPKNILCELTVEEEKMDVDDTSILYVPSVPTVVPKSNPLLPVPSADARQSKKSRMSRSPSQRSETTSLVPSSLSEERELESSRPEQKDADAVRETVDHWRQQALPPSPVTDVNSSGESRTQSLLVSQASTAFDTDWNMDDGFIDNSITPSRPMATTTTAFIPTPPSTDGPADTRPTSPVKVLDANARTEQIIRDIRARAYARAQEPSSPLSEIASLDSSEDDDSLGTSGLPIYTKLERCGQPFIAHAEAYSVI